MKRMNEIARQHAALRWNSGFYLYPLGEGCSPITLEDTPGYTLPAPHLAGSPCTLWYNLYTLQFTKRLFNAFRISGVTFGLRSQIALNFKFAGAPPRTPLENLQLSLRPPGWLAAPSPRTHPALGASGFGRKLSPVPVTCTPSC